MTRTINARKLRSLLKEEARMMKMARREVRRNKK